MMANPAPQFFFPAQQQQRFAFEMEQSAATQTRYRLRKRKPEGPPENNERLSKRLSLLNLEHSGAKLYVPVESQQPQSSPIAYPSALLPNGNHATAGPNGSPNGTPPTKHHRRHRLGSDGGTDDASLMDLDNSKYKVYIRNLDDELSSSDSESETDRLIFLPDIEKHLRSNRIPPAVLAAKPDAADVLGKQLVLYQVPSSLTVPEEQDSVRKAILEARQRLREKHMLLQQTQNQNQQVPPALPSSSLGATTTIPEQQNSMLSYGPVSQGGGGGYDPDSDPDAMELD
ncbi:hypothetical protein QBC47DRAFT_155400 [Echria macrotheca]|uniref:Uncharacterized protein n=1 Tax=Echria macrotheca TaxID=438768 RepID=A0AAJ0F7Z1_9PEZI|nr:hypothetical protein QBC47DRAFT_155400 [Echria macrotheca]